MKPFMQTGRGAPSPRSAAVRSGGLSMAFGDGGAGSGKKRGLASLNALAPADALAAAHGGVGSADSGAQQPHQQQLAQQRQYQQQPQHQQQQQQHKPLPPGGLTTQFGSGQFSVGSCAGDDGLSHAEAHSQAPSPLSPHSELAQQPVGSLQCSPLSEALAISAHPRRKVPRRHPASAANSATALDLAAADAAAAGDSDGDEFPPGAGNGGHGGWAIAGVPPHLMAGGGDATMSLPHGPASPLYGEFRPGSVYEGAGRKLRGTEAMRMRNAVLRQTGFLEPQNCDNMFADHTAGDAPAQPQLATSVG